MVIDGEEESDQSASTSKIFNSKCTNGVQFTLNQIYKRGDKEKVDA